MRDAPLSLPAATAQTFIGARTVPLDVQRQTAANLRTLQAKLRELEVRIASVRRDQALRPADKAAAIRRLTQQRQQILYQFRREGAGW